MPRVRPAFAVLAHLRPVRHGALLGIVALAFLAAGRRHLYVAVPGSFLVYGAVHALTLTATLHERPPPRRMLVFVALAALLSLASAVLGMHAVHWLSAFPARYGARVVLGLAAALGALTYAALIRTFWMPGLSVRSMGVIALACVLVTLAASMAGISMIDRGAVPLTVAWWCAMSAGLCYHDRVPG